MKTTTQIAVILTSLLLSIGFNLNSYGNLSDDKCACCDDKCVEMKCCTSGCCANDGSSGGACCTENCVTEKCKECCKGMSGSNMKSGSDNSNLNDNGVTNATTSNEPMAAHENCCKEKMKDCCNKK